MSTYIPRRGAEALMPEEYQREIIQEVSQESIIMSLGYRAANMSRNQRRLPVLSVLPTAYFTNPGSGDTGDLSWKQTTKLMWANKYLDVEELNVIVAIPEAVLADADYDIWGEAKPKLLEAYGYAIDQAILYGLNAPAVWPKNIVAQCQAVGNYVTLPQDNSKDLYDVILGEDGLVAKVEEDGFMVNGHVSSFTMRGKLRGLRASDNMPIFKPLQKEGMQGSTVYSLDGEPMYFPKNGCIIPDRSLIICGDWTKLMYAIRQDITWKILDQAVIQDPSTGEIVYNLAQQNMVALRSCMRIAWQVPNPLNRVNQDNATRYPFSVLGAAGS